MRVMIFKPLFFSIAILCGSGALTIPIAIAGLPESRASELEAATNFYVRLSKVSLPIPVNFTLLTSRTGAGDPSEFVIVFAEQRMANAMGSRKTLASDISIARYKTGDEAITAASGMEIEGVSILSHSIFIRGFTVYRYELVSATNDGIDGETVCVNAAVIENFTVTTTGSDCGLVERILKGVDTSS